MSALRVVIFSGDIELDVSNMSWDDRFAIIHACNAFWKTFETDEVKYRTLPEGDGELYVTPGNFHECRCSDAEMMLEDSFPHTLDAEHFYATEVPEDMREKTTLYYHEEDGGCLRLRKLVGELHPLFGPYRQEFLESLKVRYDFVTWEEGEEEQDSVS